jgi:hypothetical protein
MRRYGEIYQIAENKMVGKFRKNGRQYDCINDVKRITVFQNNKWMIQDEMSRLG